ncbi:MAG: hypothetical protein OXC62_16355 [Aestuariivita sp.]|nr:hypothetical protein [Aestuariivita sp.]
MLLSCGTFIEVGGQDDVKEHVIGEPIETGSYPLWIRGVFVRERGALIQQCAGEVQRAVTRGKGAVSVPGGMMDIMGADVTMKVTEDIFMRPRAGFDDGGGGQGTLRRWHGSLKHQPLRLYRHDVRRRGRDGR